MRDGDGGFRWFEGWGMGVGIDDGVLDGVVGGVSLMRCLVFESGLDGDRDGVDGGVLGLGDIDG